MTRVITRWASVLSILFVLMLSIPAATPPVAHDLKMEPAEHVDLFDYVRAERSARIEIDG